MTSARLLTGIPQIAEYMGVRPRRLYRIIDQSADKMSRLPIWKWGGRWMAEEADIDRWLEVQKLKGNK